MDDRALYLSTALLELLSDMGSTPIGARQIERHMGLKTMPKATPSETQDRVKWAEGEGFITSIRDKNLGLFYTITISGRAWLQQNG